jgi:peptidoglycan/xylan/chitin deacetylase (PgdA/CDA1 family)
MAIIAGGGYLGKDFINAQIERTRAISEELAVMYAPEDYVYPEIPSGVVQKVKAARDAAYREAMANAYVPKRAEVPNLYKYDYVKTCYLTFDDGPSVEVTSSILDTLKKYNVPATFFVVGKNAEQYPELIKRMDAEGHSIGNHSYSHNYEYMYSGDPEFDSEMIACKNAINNILGRNYGTMLYRFPGGSFEVYKQYYIWNIESEGYQYVDWNSLTGDSEVQNPDAEYIMNALKESTNNGTAEDIVVLLHDAGAKKITADTTLSVVSAVNITHPNI